MQFLKAAIHIAFNSTIANIHHKENALLEKSRTPYYLFLGGLLVIATVSAMSLFHIARDYRLCTCTWTGSNSQGGSITGSGSQPVIWTDISLRNYQNWKISGEFVSNRPVHIDLYAIGYDRPAQEHIVTAGNHKVSIFLNSGGGAPTSAQLRIFSDEAFTAKNLIVESENEIKPFMVFFFMGGLILCACCIFFTASRTQRNILLIFAFICALILTVNKIWLYVGTGDNQWYLPNGV